MFYTNIGNDNWHDNSFVELKSYDLKCQILFEVARFPLKSLRQENKIVASTLLVEKVYFFIKIVD